MIRRIKRSLTIVVVLWGIFIGESTILAPLVVHAESHTAFSDSWAGAEVYKPSTQLKFVEGRWIVPTYHGYQSNQSAFLWVGLGGDGTIKPAPDTDVLVQLEERDQPQQDGTLQSSIVAEVVSYHPYDREHISDRQHCHIEGQPASPGQFFKSPGQFIDCQYILTLPNGLHSGDALQFDVLSSPEEIPIDTPGPIVPAFDYFAVTDFTTHQATHWSTNNWPAGYSNTAEWIVERPQNYTSTGEEFNTPLANFGSVDFVGWTSSSSGKRFWADDPSTILITNTDLGDTKTIISTSKWLVVKNQKLLPAFRIVFNSKDQSVLRFLRPLFYSGDPYLTYIDVQWKAYRYICDQTTCSPST